jgi:hypothetical protein
MDLVEIENAKPFPNEGETDGSKNHHFKRPIIILAMTFLCIAIVDIMMVVMTKVVPVSVDMDMGTKEASILLGLKLDAPFHISSLSVRNTMFTFFV